MLSSRYLNLPGSRKFRQHWVGPFRVLARIGETAYRLDMSGRFARVHPVFHVSLLRPHSAGGSTPAPPEPVEVDGALEYEVEAILGHRARGSSRQFLVRWRGYDASEDTWQSAEDLANAPTILEEYCG